MKHTLWYKEGNRLDYKPVQPEAADACETIRAEGARLLTRPDHDDDRTCIQIYRYDPDKDASPTCRTTTSSSSRRDRMLLDALVKLRRRTTRCRFRRSCREGVCGSDAMNINGKNGLACITKIADAAASRSCSGRCPACR